MIGSSKNNRENYLRKCSRTQEKENRVKFKQGIAQINNAYEPEGTIRVKQVTKKP